MRISEKIQNLSPRKWSNAPNKKRVLIALSVLVLVLAAVAAGGIFLTKKHNSDQAAKVADLKDKSVKQELKMKSVQLQGAGDDDSLRSLITVYAEAGDYTKAQKTAEQVATKTDSSEDYIAWVQLCLNYEVPDRTACLQKALAGLTPKLSTLSFRDSYSLGYSLEQSGDKKTAADYFQHAYDVYDTTQTDEYTMSQDKLKAHIDELRK